MMLLKPNSAILLFLFLILHRRQVSGFFVQRTEELSRSTHLGVSSDDDSFLYKEPFKKDEELHVDDGYDRIKESSSRDWCNSQFAIINAPSSPDPDLDAEEVALNCIRSLQWVDNPTPNSGLKRIYEFLTIGCREVVTGRMGGKSLSTFVQHSLYAPAFQPFMGASRVELGMCTYTPAQAPFRGPLASFPVKVYGAPVLALQHMSGMIRSGVAQTPPVIDMVIRLEQQRRPPNQGCWMIYEVLDVRYAFAGDMGNTHVGA